MAAATVREYVCGAVAGAAALAVIADEWGECGDAGDDNLRIARAVSVNVTGCRWMGGWVKLLTARFISIIDHRIGSLLSM